MAAMAPFGGGMGCSGKTCGTLSGALAVIGFTMGKIEGSGHDHKLMWKISHKMVVKFSDITGCYGGSDCSDIAAVDWRDRKAVKNFYRDPESNRRNCVKVIRETSHYLHSLILENFPSED